MQFYTLNNVNYNTIDIIQTQNNISSLGKDKKQKSKTLQYTKTTITQTIITPVNMILTQQKLKNNQVLTF